MRVSFSLPLSNYNLNRRAIGACLVAFLGAFGANQLGSSALDKPTFDGAHGAKGSKVKVSYDLRSLHNDGSPTKEKAEEVMWAFKTNGTVDMSGVNKGLRDQYVAGLSHLYANDVNQRLANCFYTQGPKAIWQVTRRATAKRFTSTNLPDLILVAMDQVSPPPSTVSHS